MGSLEGCATYPELDLAYLARSTGRLTLSILLADYQELMPSDAVERVHRLYNALQKSGDNACIKASHATMCAF